MHPKSVSAVAVIGIAMSAPAAFAGPEWVELGDAGPLASNAQRTFGAGNLNSISGALTGSLGLLGIPGDFEDMYLITISDPSSFSMTIVNADFDAQLFLFNLTVPGEAFGLLANNDTSGDSNPSVGNMATDGTGASVNLPGLYAIAISGLGRDPVSNGGLIFNFGNPTEVSGPDGPGGLLPHIGWIGEGQTGSYTIVLTGAKPSDLPEPGTAALLSIAVACTFRRRRR